jgi:predicted secreted protein
VKHVFKWAVENELVPGVYHSLAAIAGLRENRSDARESEPVRPVPDEHVYAVEKFVSPQVRAMIRLQMLTSNLSEVTNARDLTLNIEKNMVDVTTRATNGWKAEKGALKTGSVEFSMVYDVTDTHMTAFFTNATVAMAVLDGSDATLGTEGLWSDLRSGQVEQGRTDRRRADGRGGDQAVVNGRSAGVGDSRRMTLA